MARNALSVVSDADGYLKPLKNADLDKEDGTSFGFQERLFYAFDDGAVLDYGNWEAIDIRSMLEADYKARQIMNATILPAISTRKSIEAAPGDSGETDLINAVFANTDGETLSGTGCKTGLDTVVAQMMSAVAYKRSFHEKVWTLGRGELAGRYIYDKIAYRPQTTCRMMRHPRTGDIIGFEQDAYLSGAGVALTRRTERPRIKRNRSVIHVHGTWLDPINGISIMEVPYWAYKTKQKLLFLWFQYLEGVSLPRTTVITGDEGASRRIAAAVRATKNSGVVPVWSDDPENTKIEALDLAGAQGAAEFMKAITFLDQCATQENLMGFLDLTGSEKSGGSYALSADGSDFFLQAGEARDRELENSVRREIFAPLVRYNFGPSGKVPFYRMAPLTAEDNAQAIAMFQALLASRDPSTAAVPHEFIGELAGKIAGAFGLDADKIVKEFEKAAADGAIQAAQQSAQMANGGGPQVAALNAVATKATQVAAKASGKPAPVKTP